MKTHAVLFSTLIFSLIALDTSQAQEIAPTCSITESGIVGGWKLEGKGYFDEMNFSIESENHVFNSWISGFPDFVNKTWSFKECSIYIEPLSKGKPQVKLKVVGFENETLTVRESNSHYDSQYKAVGRISNAHPPFTL